MRYFDMTTKKAKQAIAARKNVEEMAAQDRAAFEAFMQSNNPDSVPALSSDIAMRLGEAIEDEAKAAEDGAELQAEKTRVGQQYLYVIKSMSGDGFTIDEIDVIISKAFGFKHNITSAGDTGGTKAKPRTLGQVFSQCRKVEKVYGFIPEIYSEKKNDNTLRALYAAATKKTPDDTFRAAFKSWQKAQEKHGSEISVDDAATIAAILAKLTK
tara:strand:+ start:66 stop:701 length:636 start_codon:yes stop_codon:yes gene_type:complete